MANNVINNVQYNLGQLARSQEQIAANQRVLRPSDDPNVMGQFISVTNNLTYNEQYEMNINDGLSYLEVNDDTLASLKSLLETAYQHALSASNTGTTNEQNMEAIAQQIDVLIDEAVDLANETVGGKYIYAGTDNNRAPFVRNGDVITYNGNTKGIYREVMAGTEYRVDAPGVTTGIEIEPTNDQANSIDLPDVQARQLNKDIVGKLEITIDATGEPKIITEYELDGITVNDDLITASTFDSTTRIFTVTSGDLEGLEIEFPAGGGDATYTITIDNSLGVFGNVDIKSNVVCDPNSPKDEADRGVFDALFDFRDRLLEYDQDSDSDPAVFFGESISDLQEKMDETQVHWTKVGARYSHFTSLKAQLEDQNLNLTARFDYIVGADFTELTITAAQQEFTYNASLLIGANIMNTSLLNYV